MEINLKKLFIVLFSILILIFSIHTLIVYLSVYHIAEIDLFIATRFDINREGNIPTWYSSFLLLFVSFSAFTISFLTKRLDNFTSKSVLFWRIVSAVYLFISFDEVSQIHELFDKLGIIKWVKVYAPLALLFLVYCIYYLVIKKSENHIIRNFILFGLMVHFLGALVAEYIAYIYELTLKLQHLEIFIEESFEVMGTILVLMGSLTKLNEILDSMQFSNKNK